MRTVPRDPRLHFTEPLTACAGLAAQRLLGDQAVWTCASGLNLVVYQVVKFAYRDSRQ